MTQTDLPTTVKRIEGADPERLARLVGAYDDLQTVLRACERLVELFQGEHSDVDVEALWTVVLLSYSRIFAAGDNEPALTEDDLVKSVTSSADAAAKAKEDGDKKDPVKVKVDVEKVREWHHVIMHLRDHYADAHDNPRETYTAGVALGADGAVNAVAVTSVSTPLVDETAVRQAGAIAYPLIAVLDERIGPLQQQIFAAMREVPKHEIERLDDIEVSAG